MFGVPLSEIVINNRNISDSAKGRSRIAQDGDPEKRAVLRVSGG